MTEQEVNNLIDSKIGKTKMSQLPEATQTSGLYSIGYNGNQSVKYKANLLQGDPLTVRKTYQTEAEAIADKNPIDTATSLPLKIGQFVSIVADTATAKNGIYRIASISGDGTMSLELQGKLGEFEYIKTRGTIYGSYPLISFNTTNKTARVPALTFFYSPRHEPIELRNYQDSEPLSYDVTPGRVGMYVNTVTEKLEFKPISSTLENPSSETMIFVGAFNRDNLDSFDFNIENCEIDGERAGRTTDKITDVVRNKTLDNLLPNDVQLDYVPYAVTYGNNPLFIIDTVNKTIKKGEGLIFVMWRGQNHEILASSETFSYEGFARIGVYFDTETSKLEVADVTALYRVPTSYVLLGMIDPSMKNFYGLDPANLSIDGEIYNPYTQNEQEISTTLLNSIPRGTIYGSSPAMDINTIDRTIVVNCYFVSWANKRSLLPAEHRGEELEFFDTLQTAVFFDTVENKYVSEWFISDYIIPEHYILICIISSDATNVYGMDIEDFGIDGNLHVRKQIKDYVDVSTSTQYYFLDEVGKKYDIPNDVESAGNSGSFQLTTAQIDKVYDVYDDLVDNFPEYVTKIYLGDDATGLPINQYDFTPPRLDGTALQKRPKIIIIAGVHGHEPASAWCSALFFKDLCYNHSTKDVLSFLRWNVDLKIIAIANPYGFNNNQRANSNGVDCNRNMPYMWLPSEPDPDPTSALNRYSGASPASELEAQYIVNFVDSNSDAEFAIDYHNIGYNYPLFYSATDATERIGVNVLKTLNREWAVRYPDKYPVDGSLVGYVGQTSKNGTITSYCFSKGIEAITLESPQRVVFDTEYYGKATIEVGIEQLGNTIATMCKSLR